MPRPPIDLSRKIKDIVQHVQPLPDEATAPILHYQRTTSDIWASLAYLERAVGARDHYGAVVERHLGRLYGMALVNLQHFRLHYSLSLFLLVDKQLCPGETMHNMQDAIEQLYRAFAKNPRPRHIDGCPCCTDKKDIFVLLAKSLRAITPQELSSYASCAFLTVGDVADYLYFLPRILEITATEPSWWPDPEVTGRAIQGAHPDLWTDAQRSALNQLYSVNYLSPPATTIFPRWMNEQHVWQRLEKRQLPSSGVANGNPPPHN